MIKHYNILTFQHEERIICYQWRYAGRVMKDSKAVVVKLIGEAQEKIQQAHAALICANAMASEVPVVIELREVAKRLTGIMQGVSKLRGLE